MLFVQNIVLSYQKDVRYANYANQRRSIRFWELPTMDLEENEVFVNRVCLGQSTLNKTFYGQDEKNIHCYRNMTKSYGAEVFYNGRFINNSPFSGRLAVVKDDDSYQIKYCGKNDLGFYSTKMTIGKDEYGRVIFNERGTYEYSGIWYYELNIYNFVNADYSKYNPKLFFKKEPDYEFEDMRKLRYNG